jgi:glycosyltransferase involved in cell wall biosynthesis
MKTFSIIIPTLNAERTLEECLSHLSAQNYPKDDYEIIISDGGSTDKTLEIAKKFGANSVENKLKTGEAGKLVGLKSATAEIIIFLDSDNILTDKDWFTKMKKPFQEAEIAAAEPIRYDTRKTDHYLTRYFAYIGMGDPLNLFLGNYDRICAITDRWTGLDIEQEKKDGYLKLHLYKGNLPTIGANGFAIRKQLLDPLLTKEYLFDVDIMNLIMNGEPPSCYAAKVDTGVVHLFSGSLATFMRKQRRRIKDYVYYNSVNMRSHAETEIKNPLFKVLYPGGVNFGGLILFIFCCLTILPLILQALIGFSRKPDWVWILHPLICIMTLYVYATERIKSFFKKSIYDRSQWSQ